MIDRSNGVSQEMLNPELHASMLTCLTISIESEEYAFEIETH